MSSKILVLSLISVAACIAEPTSDRAPRGNQMIYFPGQRPTKPSPTANANVPLRFVANVTRCAERNQTFCTKIDEYPMDHIKTLLREHAIRFTDVVSDIETNDITDRIEGFDDNDEYMCNSYEKVIYPKSGKTQNGQELFIFNTDDYKQGVRVSMCSNSGQSCKMTENFPNGIKTECKQQFVYRQLLSLSPNGQAIKDHFEFPACCSCVLHRR